MNKQPQGSPVFLVGPVRSGSTFLRLMLDAHPDISNPGECDFLFDMIDDQGKLPEKNAYIQWLETNRIFLAKNLHIDKKLQTLDLIRSFVGQMRTRKPVLCMNVHRYFHRIPYVFPEAHYIHLIRDPRDVARSCIGMGWAGNVYYGVDIWIDAEQSWRRLRETLSSRQFMEIKYEDLVNSTDAGLDAICKFLNLQYTKRMMDYASNSTYAPPDKSLSYQWKKKYTKRDLQLIEGKLGGWLNELGYMSGEHGALIPGAWEKMSLFLHNKKFRISHQISRYGISLYLQSWLSSKIGSQNWENACKRKKNVIDINHLK